LYFFVVDTLGTKLYPFHRRCIARFYHFPSQLYVQVKPTCNIQQIYCLRWFSEEVKSVADAITLRNYDGICWKCK